MCLESRIAASELKYPTPVSEIMSPPGHSDHLRLQRSPDVLLFSIQMTWPAQDSSLESPAPEADALSIRPTGLLRGLP